MSLHVNAHLVAEEHYSIMHTFLSMKDNKGLLPQERTKTWEISSRSHEYHTVSVETDILNLLFFPGCKIS